MKWGDHTAVHRYHMDVLQVCGAKVATSTIGKAGVKVSGRAQSVLLSVISQNELKPEQFFLQKDKEVYTWV